jgi:hypothetical protein
MIVDARRLTLEQHNQMLRAAYSTHHFIEWIPALVRVGDPLVLGSYAFSRHLVTRFLDRWWIHHNG